MPGEGSRLDGGISSLVATVGEEAGTARDAEGLCSLRDKHRGRHLAQEFSSLGDWDTH